ncbi:LamG domain-containing protein, partial [Akkermansiaceae bacterium]|nr:LamG domain-containing protein [Akkermansiaceae bacterium]
MVAGTVGSAVDVNGGTQHVLMANPGTPVIPPNTSYSISLWAKRDASGVNGWLIGQGDTGAQRQSLHIGFRNNDQTAHAFWSDDLQWFPTAATDTTGWHQWVVTYDAATDEQYMYVDGGGAGNFVNRTTTNGDFLGSGTNDFWVGRRRDGQNFDGQIDDVQVYSGVLSAGEVSSLF